MKYKKRRALILLSVFFILGLLALSCLYILQKNLVFYYTPSEFLAKSEQQNGNNKIVRIGGLVKDGSITYKDKSVEFTLTDNIDEMRIKYEGILPNMFSDKQGAVLRGEYDSNTKIFLANQILIKHDERYKIKKDEHNKYTGKYYQKP